MRHVHLIIPIALSLNCGITAAACLSNITVDADGYAPSWVNDPQGRGTGTIIYSSALTLFLSSWMSLHLNIPAHNDSSLKMLLRCGTFGSISFLFPEVIVFMALGQWVQVRTFREALNEARQNWLDSAFHNGVEHEDYDEEQASGPFSNLYAWYVLMGGFGIESGDRYLPFEAEEDLSRTTNAATKSKQKLLRAFPAHLMFNLKGILVLTSKGYFIHLSDDAIKDKLKSDYLAKLLVCVQVLWFVSQVIQRKLAHLPISLFEFHTLVSVACALLISALRFQKPRGIETSAIEHCIPLKNSRPEFYLNQAVSDFPGSESTLM